MVDTPELVPVEYDFFEARNWVFPASPFLVPGRVPYGCWNHSAAPGAYKSTIGWQIAVHIARPEIPIPGLDWEFAEHGAGLIITPDETFFEIQERGFNIADYGAFDTDDTEQVDNARPSIHVCHVFEGQTVEERCKWLIWKIGELERIHGHRIVWVQWDTLGSLLGVPQGTNAYDHAAPIQKLNHWFANSRRILFLPNHIGKDGRPIGTVAIDGYCNLNTITEMQADQQNVGILKVRNKMRGGRHWECALKAKNGLLSLDDMSPQEAAYGAHTQPARIAGILQRTGRVPVSLLAHQLGVAAHHIRAVLSRMRADGHVQRDHDRRWSLTDTGTTTEQPDDSTCRGCGEWVHPAGRDGSGYHPACDPTPQTPPAPAPTGPEAEPREDPAQTAARADAAHPQSRWRQMASREPKPVDLPEIDASFRMDGEQRVWHKSPIGAAIDLIMNARDRGRLTPVWRAPLAQEITDPLDGYHHWGQVPVRRDGQIVNSPDGDWISYDVAGSFLASYKTPLAIKALVPYHGDWTPKAAGAVLIRTPDWAEGSIGHPLGTKARPGELQWYWNPAIRLIMKLADDGLIERPEIRAMQLRTGYQGASENLLEDFYKRMKLARETFPAGSAELAYVKEMYSAWLSSASSGRYNVFQRPDWTGSIRAEAFARLWSNAWKAVTSGVQLVGMGNTDEVVFRPDDRLLELFPQDDTRIGKLKIKGLGNWKGQAADA